MRQWMVPPSILCNRHLLGEHCEHHMFVGTLKRKLKVDGYLANNLLEPLSLLSRHNELEIEMKRRGMNHLTPLGCDEELVEYLGDKKEVKINKMEALVELIKRCRECNINFYNHLITRMRERRQYV